MESSKKVRVMNRYGIHARAAARIVETAMNYDADFFMVLNGKEVDGKNLLSILSLGATQGSEVELKAVGNGSPELIKAMEDLFKNRFGEV